MEEFEHLSGRRETHEAAPLLERERGNPVGDKPVLAIVQTEAWMASNFEEEFAVAAEVDEFLFARMANGNTAEDKRSGIICKLLLSVIALFTDESDGFELLEAAFGDMDLRQE